MSLVLARTTGVVVPMVTGRVVAAMEAVAVVTVGVVVAVGVEAAAAPAVASSGDISQPDGLN